MEPLPAAQAGPRRTVDEIMTWRDHLEVPAVESGDLVQVEPLG
jgi:hypothetical protein